MNFLQMMQFINTFKNSNPNEQINRMLSSGQINQSMLQRKTACEPKPLYVLSRLLLKSQNALLSELSLRFFLYFTPIFRAVQEYLKKLSRYLKKMLDTTFAS